jgi:hypothetical protein
LRPVSSHSAAGKHTPAPSYRQAAFQPPRRLLPCFMTIPAEPPKKLFCRHTTRPIIAEFDTPHSNFVYLPAPIRSHNRCAFARRPLNPLRAASKSVIWPLAAWIFRKAGINGPQLQVMARTRSLWKEQTEMVHPRKVNPPPPKNLLPRKRSPNALMKFTSNATALQAIRSKTGSAPSANSSRNPAKPQRKPPWQRPKFT